MAAALARDLDKFDMILQADEYEKKEKKKPSDKWLSDFFKSTQNFDFQHSVVVAWNKHLRASRSIETE